ncbi:MAG: hypothetical protein H6953_06760 [Chromatiaceae bacterium]|nr:hypothetical protein [Gammaproteobacteria bacterium]MCP5305130.1 hypothetical protein [Chromatiaceae bacterium]MCP5315089.1 hypothetical protein [Chromatiaceae bacterium]
MSRHSACTASRLAPAPPLWRLAPTRAADGRPLADFMMLIPGLGERPQMVREHIAGSIREVCEAYGDQVAFADVNLAINVLWVSVTAEPGLAGRVAQSIRGRVPEARLIGGQLGASPMPVARGADWRARARRCWHRVRQGVGLLLEGPGDR